MPMLENAEDAKLHVSAQPIAGAHQGDVVPRVLDFLVIKRIDPRLPNTWGHWWIELDGEESYGWWPTPCPMGWRGALLGSRGCLNGIGTASGGTPTRDAYHGDEPDHWFHPTLITPKTDDQVRAGIRLFAQRYSGPFRWRWWWLPKPEQNCRTFQQDMFTAVGLFEEPQYLHTQGPGCPFMFEVRRVRWRAWDLVETLSGWGRSKRPKGAEDPAPSSSPAISGILRPGGAVLAAVRLSRGNGQVAPARHAAAPQDDQDSGDPNRGQQPFRERP